MNFVQKLLVISLSGLCVFTAHEALAKKEKKSRIDKTRWEEPKSHSPCKSLRNACSAAGFKKGGQKGQRLGKDCVDKILSGQSVPGVRLPVGSVEACKANRAFDPEDGN